MENLENKTNRIEVPKFIKNLGEDAVKYYVRTRKVLSRPTIMAQMQYSVTLRLAFPEKYRIYR